MQNRSITIRQVDKRLSELKKLKQLNPHPKGAVHTIRKALGMTAQQLAQRLGVSRVRVVQLERAEFREETTLRSLKQAAEALNCDLVYALVPRTSLADTVKQQAIKKAKIYMAHVSQSMSLENQSVDKKETEVQLKETVEALLSGSLKHLWDE